MPRYSTFNYGTGVYYGTSTDTTLSVSPFYSVALDYEHLFLSWATPTADYAELRVVRNHYNIPESPEDGIIVYETTTDPNGTVLRKIDGYSFDYQIGKSVYVNNAVNEAEYLKGVPALPEGRFIYYGIWVLSDDEEGDSVWTLVSALDILLAQDHATILNNTDDTPESPNANRTRTRTTHEKFMDLFPRVFTSETQSSLDEFQVGSDLYNFLSGITYTLDEVMTYADLLLPNHTKENFSADLLNAASFDANISIDNRLSTRYQRNLLREASYIASRKGTALALGTLAEAMTGFNTELISSPNSFLSNQDSTFRGGVGSWQAYAGCDIRARNLYATPLTTTEPEAIDLRYTGQVAVKTANAWISNGLNKPTTLGVPVTPNTEYSWTYYQQKNSGTGTIKTYPELHWFDINGNLVKTDKDATGTSVTTSWAQVTFTKTAPKQEQQFVSKFEVVSGTGTITITDATAFDVGDIVTLQVNVGPTATPPYPIYGGFSGKVTITAKTTSPAHTLSFTTDESDVVVGTGSTVIGQVTHEAAAFVGFKMRFDSAITGSTSYDALLAGTGLPDYYVLLDMMQFAPSSTSAFHEARGVTLKISPNKTNYSLNPSFKDVIGNWTVDDAGYTIETAIPPGLPSNTAAPNKSLKAEVSTSLTISTETNAGEIDAGRYCTFSAYMKANSGTVEINLKITSINNGVDDTTVEKTITLTTNWSREQVTVFIPTAFTNQTVRVEIEGTSGTGADIYVSATQIESAYVASDYFDGDLGKEGAEWAGTANDSASNIFINKYDSLSRLYYEIKEYLPNNTPYIVKSDAGIEYLGAVKFAGFSS